MNGVPGRVAVFVDVENVTVDDAAVVFVAAVARRRGELAVRRAYADWSSPATAAPRAVVVRHAFDSVQVTRPGAAKNAVDLRLALDALEVALRHPEIGVVVLVAGDGDYVPLVDKLLEHGKTVVGIGRKASASGRLAKACTDYQFLPVAAPPAVPRLARVPTPTEQARELLLSALPAGSSRLAGPLKARMLQLDPAFDETALGWGSFGEFLQSMTDLVSVRKQDSHWLVTVVEPKGGRRPGAATG